MVRLSAQDDCRSGYDLAEPQARALPIVRPAVRRGGRELDKLHGGARLAFACDGGCVRIAIPAWKAAAGRSAGRLSLLLHRCADGPRAANLAKRNRFVRIRI